MPVFRAEREKKVVQGRYAVDRDGVVYSDGMALKPVGGTWVSIYGERRYVSYLVARAFVPNPEGRRWVRHKNGDLRDNRAENLEWCEERERGRKRGRKPMARAIGQFSESGELVGTYYSVPDAAKAAGTSQACIRAALRRKGRSCGWYWMWL